MAASIALERGGKGFVWRITSEKEAATASSRWRRFLSRQQPLAADGDHVIASPRRGRRGQADGSGSVVRCGNALTRHASVDAHGLANSDLWQSSEQRHFTLAFLARGRSLGIIVWSHDDCDYSICEGGDIRISTEVPSTTVVVLSVWQTKSGSMSYRRPTADGIKASSRHRDQTRLTSVPLHRRASTPDPGQEQQLGISTQWSSHYKRQVRHETGS